MAPKRLTPDEAVLEIARRAKGERRVFLPGGPAEPIALREAWRRSPETAGDLRFCGVQLPGVNTFDYTTLHPTARFELFLMNADLRAALGAGRALVTPAHYSEIPRLLAARRFSVAVLHLSKPDGERRCSFGLAADFAPLLIGHADFTIALINARMPSAADGPSFPIKAADALVEIDEELAAAPPSEPREGAAIAARVAELVYDDDVVQCGIGRLPGAILAQLTNKERLQVFSGMVGDGILPLLDAGAILDAPGAITTGLVVGSERLYERMGKERRLKLTPVTHTHAHAVLSRIEKFVSINACLEVDLFGQINAEFAQDRQIAGVGGLVDFIRGARAAPGGRAIVALHAEGMDGASRIVPRLAHGAVSVTRADAPIIVTEHGTVDLNGMDMIARAHALIELASPRHRAALEEAWAKMRKKL